MANQAASVEYLPARGHRRHRPLELPGVHADGLDRLRARGRQRGRLQAQRADPRGAASGSPTASARSSPTRRSSRSSSGRGETGNALCRSAIDKLAFTGSPATGRKVMAACAENLTPVLIEAGGKDALLVDEDADVEAAADAAAWGAFSNAGQTCAGVERVYVHEQVHDAFLASLTRRAEELSAGTDAGARVRADDAARARSTSPVGTSTTRSPGAAAPSSAVPRPWGTGSSSRRC